MPKASEIDWLARVEAGGPNFRLPSDGPDIPSNVFADRVRAYYGQLWAAMKLRPGRPPDPQQSLL